jgi:hypothetical protein
MPITPSCIVVRTAQLYWIACACRCSTHTLVIRAHPGLILNHTGIWISHPIGTLSAACSSVWPLYVFRMTYGSHAATMIRCVQRCQTARSSGDVTSHTHSASGLVSAAALLRWCVSWQTVSLWRSLVQRGHPVDLSPVAHCCLLARTARRWLAGAGRQTVGWTQTVLLLLRRRQRRPRTHQQQAAMAALPSQLQHVYSARVFRWLASQCGQGRVMLQLPLAHLKSSY